VFSPTATCMEWPVRTLGHDGLKLAARSVIPASGGNLLCLAANWIPQQVGNDCASCSSIAVVDICTNRNLDIIKRITILGIVEIYT
ncbi:MAG TPA: hypothetical protein VEC12_12420, partial [Bacteroidia bacterium]|nr:hypothetical protein [Bacteroidia bacterium]